MLRGVSDHRLRISVFLCYDLLLWFLFKSCCGLPEDVEFEDYISILGLNHRGVATLGNRLCLNGVRKKAVLYLCVLEEDCFQLIFWLSLALNTLADNLLQGSVRFNRFLLFNRLKSHLIFVRQDRVYPTNLQKFDVSDGPTKAKLPFISDSFP